ncbi:hypothetical protein UlMin_046043 [Ulmus minor]
MSIFSENINIREVWAYNLEEEMLKIRGILHNFPYVGLDTKYPGFVMTLATQDWTKPENNYLPVKDNVNWLKLIQLGLTFFDENGNLPTCGTDQYCVWQFNFREFNPREDLHSAESIQLLRQNGIDFQKNNEKGIDARIFCDRFMSSGVTSDKNRRWVTFRGEYDFGYLIKMLTSKNLPEKLHEFYENLKSIFPAVYDIKHVMKYSVFMDKNKVAADFRVRRFENGDQAGSDSLLTSRIFMKLKEVHSEAYFENHVGHLHSLAES